VGELDELVDDLRGKRDPGDFRKFFQSAERTGERRSYAAERLVDRLDPGRVLDMRRLAVAQCAGQLHDIVFRGGELAGDLLELAAQYAGRVAAGADVGGELPGVGAKRLQIGLCERQLRAQLAGVGGDGDRKVVRHLSTSP
jgi:hypothetical protein